MYGQNDIKDKNLEIFSPSKNFRFERKPHKKNEALKYPIKKMKTVVWRRNDMLVISEKILSQTK